MRIHDVRPRAAVLRDRLAACRDSRRVTRAGVLGIFGPWLALLDWRKVADGIADGGEAVGSGSHHGRHVAYARRDHQSATTALRETELSEVVDACPDRVAEVVQALV